MECSRCKNKMSAQEYYFFFTNCLNLNTSNDYSSDVVLKNHQIFHNQIVFLMNNKKQLNFFDKEHHKKREINRPVLIHSLLTESIEHEEHCDNCHRTEISLIDLKFDQIATDCQLPLWIVTQPKPTNMIDGTTYVIVRDKFDRHVRLVISNWCYTIPTNETKSMESLSHILDELLSIGSMIKLHDPLLTKCSIDNQATLRCNSPNTELILCERMKKCFVFDKLDDLRDRGNQAYIRGDLQLALDYYTFAIHRIITMAGMAISKDNEHELNLFRNAFQNDLARLHSNRSACYLRERLYFGASMDSTVVVTGHLFSKTSDDIFLKCLYRLTCANLALEEFSTTIFELINLSETRSINPQIRLKYSFDFQQLHSNLNRLKDECAHGIYHLKTMFHQQYFDQKTIFDFQTYHSNFYNTSFIKNRRGKYYAKCAIPAGTLLIAQNAFVYVKSGENEQRRLLNEVEKHLIMAPTAKEFDTARLMPVINQWFDNETDADEDDHETYPKAIPWGVLLKTQQQNPFRSKTLIGWWPDVSILKIVNDSKQKSNCLWFICGKTLFLFNYTPMNKNDELIVANREKIGSFMNENQKKFVFLLGKKNKIRLNEIFDELKQTQVYFSM